MFPPFLPPDNSVGYTGDFPLGRLLFPPLDYLAVEYWRQRKVQAPPLFQRWLKR